MTSGKRPLREFLGRNPFESPFTLGFFYREKMRAIHRVAPDGPVGQVLELGGGRSGLSRLLYPDATIVNVDPDRSVADAPCNREPGIRFVCGSATALEFDDESFDVVTMFDVLEHIVDHQRAVMESLRVLKRGGWLVISAPNEHWRFPYYRWMKPFCPTEQHMFAEWGHVRRGYSISELADLIRLSCVRSATFISPVTVICHDVSFSRAPVRVKRAVCYGLWPVTWLGYAFHGSRAPGTETVTVWQKPRQH